MRPPELPSVFAPIARFASYKGVRQTKNGDRHLYELKVTPAFWDLYEEREQEMLDEGLGLKQTDEHWKAVVWVKPSEIENAIAARSTQLSSTIESDLVVPMGGGVKLRPYQLAFIEYALERYGTWLVDPPGTGKTYSGVGLANKMGAKQILVIVPAATKIQVLESWSRSWLGEGPVNEIVNGSGVLARMKGDKRVKFKNEGPPADGVVIVNYELVAKMPWLSQRVWDLMIVDEAHNLKERKSGRTKVIYGGIDKNEEGKITKRYKRIEANKIVLMSGTPAVNKPVEMWNGLRRLAPTIFSDFMRFGRRYCDAQHNGFGWNFDGASNIEELHALLRRVCMVRREKAELQPMQPPKERILVKLDVVMTSVQQKASTATVEAFQRVVNQLEAYASENFEQTAALRHEIALSKVKAAAEFIAGLDMPIVVMGHHKDALRQLGDLLVKQGRVPTYHTGDESADQRDKAKKDFISGKSDTIMGTIGALGTGVDGLQHRSCVMVFLESSWVPGQIEQAEDRLARDGQPNTVLIYHLVVDGSYEAVILQRALEKQAVLTKLISGEKAAPAPKPVAKPSVAVPAAPSVVSMLPDPVVPADWQPDPAAIAWARRIVRWPACVSPLMRDMMKRYLDKPYPEMETTIVRLVEGMQDLQRKAGPVPDTIDKRALQKLYEALCAAGAWPVHRARHAAIAAVVGVSAADLGHLKGMQQKIKALGLWNG